MNGPGQNLIYLEVHMEGFLSKPWNGFKILLVLGAVLFSTPALTEDKRNWADRINFRGYTQIRYNRLLETNSNLKCEQCDKSWGGDSSFLSEELA